MLFKQILYSDLLRTHCNHHDHTYADSSTKAFYHAEQHRQLLTIFGINKGVLVHTANRMRKWSNILLVYDVDFNFIGTDDFGHAGILLRLIANQPINQEVVIENIIAGDEGAEGEISFSLVSVDINRAETCKDDALTLLKNYINNVWPPRSTINSMDVSIFLILKKNFRLLMKLLFTGTELSFPQPAASESSALSTRLIRESFE